MFNKLDVKEAWLLGACGIALLALGVAGGSIFDSTRGIPGLGAAGFSSDAPPYLKSLTDQGMVIDEIKDYPATGDAGWRLWEIRRSGDRLLAYSHQSDPDIVIMGGEMLGAEGSPLGTTAQHVHGLSQLTERDITSFTESLPLGLSTADGRSYTYLVLDPSYETIEPLLGAVMTAAELTPLRVIAYPEADQVGSMENLLAIFEADYREPAGQSKFVTDYRGGNLGFTASPESLLLNVINGERLTVRAPENHPASQQAFQAVSKNLYFKERLGLSPEGQGVALSVTEEGGVTALPLKTWLEQNGQFSVIDTTSQEG